MFLNAPNTCLQLRLLLEQFWAQQMWGEGKGLPVHPLPPHRHQQHPHQSVHLLQLMKLCGHVITIQNPELTSRGFGHMDHDLCLLLSHHTEDFLLPKEETWGVHAKCPLVMGVFPVGCS